LHWNSLKVYGGGAIFEAVYTNEYLKVLDLSWNSIGTCSTKENIVKIIKALSKESKSLVHLDLSFNKFTLEESLAIQKAIEKNKVMLGFHFEGN